MSSDSLSETEQAALHELQLGVEKIHRGYGALLEFHHEIGGGMDRLDSAESKLREAGHDELADVLRDELLPAGVIDERWTYELVESFEDGFYADVTAFEAETRARLADGEGHVTERRQQRRWREHADDWDTDG